MSAVRFYESPAKVNVTRVFAIRAALPLINVASRRGAENVYNGKLLLQSAYKTLNYDQKHGAAGTKMEAFNTLCCSQHCCSFETLPNKIPLLNALRLETRKNQ
jgi:hypothetical protein